MSLQAVITGDIVNSTKLNAPTEKKLVTLLTNLFGDHKMEFYRGDSFQAYIKDPEQALCLALLARTAAISIARNGNEELADVRLSIGLGNVNAPVRALKTAKGEAFVLSGRKFDEMSGSRQQRLTITCANALANVGFQIIADHINIIFEKMTGKQAEVIFELLKGEMQKSISKKLGKTKSTIHQLSTSGKWLPIQQLLQHYENIIKLIL